MKLIVCILMFLLLANISGAHPPKKMEVNMEDGQLTVVVNHPVGNTKLHLVDKIEVYVNGKKVVRQTYKTQATSDEQKAIYYLPGVVKDDVVKVKAHCNKYGVKTKSITIE